jgi:photosystem II stability/assembly factor-like uncharacterized protein
MRRAPIVAVLAAVLVSVVPSGAFANSHGQSEVPDGFHAQSMSWTSPEKGWMLGVAPCGQQMCTTVLGTGDGGGTWNTLGTVRAPLTTEETTGVTAVRFADDLHGWAFDPALWATADGGVSWKRQFPPGGGHVVLAIAGDSEAVYAVVSPCRLNHPCGQAVSLWRTTVETESWTQIPITLPAATTAALAVHGVVAYLVAPVFSFDGVLEVTTDGQQWSSRPNPCVAAHDETLSDVAPVSDTDVALLCVGNPGFGKAEKRVLRSGDTGQTTRPAGTTPINGITSRLAAAPNGTLMVSSSSDGSWLYRNAGGRTWTTSVSDGDGGQGWNDLVFTTNRVGFVIHGPWAFCCGGGPGELWQTTDGGITWTPM